MSFTRLSLTDLRISFSTGNTTLQLGYGLSQISHAVTGDYSENS